LAGDRRSYAALNTLLTAALVCSLAVFTCFALYRYDNKYTAAGPQGANGVLTLDSLMLRTSPAIFLTDGWAYYGHQLLTPEDLAANQPSPDRYTFIGRFGGFEAGDPKASPHGSASYRLTIDLPQDVRTYSLALPEIYSAYRLYVNGRPAAAMGDPDPSRYRPETGNQTVSIEAGGRIDLLFAVSDYSYLYSGLVYPPAFGQPKAVAALLNERLAFRCALCAAALTIGLLSLLLGLLNRKTSSTILYGLLCLFFVGYVSYPITRTLATGFQPQYMLESLSYVALLLVVMLLAQQVCRFPNQWGAPFILLGGLMCLAAAALPFLLPLGNLRLMMAYSAMVSLYEWATAGFITVLAMAAAWKNTAHAKILLYGFLVFDVSLVMDRLLPLYEPIVTGWFIELAGFVLVLFIGVAIGQEVAAQYRNTAILTERANSMERLYQSQQSYFTVLRREIEETKKIRHDTRHHFTMIDSLVRNKQYDKLSAYVTSYGITARDTDRTDEYGPIDVINVLSAHYSVLAAQHRIDLQIRFDLSAGAGEPGQVNMSDSDLCCLYSNLLENALEACLRVQTDRRAIRVAVVRPAYDSLTICVWNTTDGQVRADGDSFLSSKGARGMGYGLLSIRAIAEKYDGQVTFRWEQTERMFESSVTVTA